ncbi:MAG: ribonuclease H [Actinomycetota bacterium]
MEDRITLVTDGACSANGREGSRGGWAAILRVPGAPERVLTGGEAPSTNNRMELIAAIEGLRAAPDGGEVDLVTDSSYVANAIGKGWLDSWQRRGWKTADKRPVANRELWEELLVELARLRRVRPTLVRGHAGHGDNERADRLAVDAAVRDWPPRARRQAPPTADAQLGLDL